MYRFIHVVASYSFTFSEAILPDVTTFIVQLFSTLLLLPIGYLIFFRLPKRFKETNRRLKQLEDEVEKLNRK